MKDQHKLIKGYRELSQEEIDNMNRVKNVGNAIEELISELQKSGADPLWLDHATMDLKVGIMGLVRSIAKPRGF